VRLVCDGSWAQGHLKKLEEQGVEILACSTCLEYFGLTDKLLVGKPTNMVRSIQSMLTTDMVCL
jgi:intracellular sulfur oxidation DsrE/DsrF family protein